MAGFLAQCLPDGESSAHTVPGGGPGGPRFVKSEFPFLLFRKEREFLIECQNVSFQRAENFLFGVVRIPSLGYNTFGGGIFWNSSVWKRLYFEQVSMGFSIWDGKTGKVQQKV